MKNLFVIIRDYCRKLVASATVEEFHVLYLDGKRRLISEETHSRGTFDQADVYPREVARRALSLNAIYVILVHNHPCGNTNPSISDVKASNECIKAFDVIGIELLDSIIVSGKQCRSLKDEGYLKKMF